jgi:hypothetical protein
MARSRGDEVKIERQFLGVEHRGGVRWPNACASSTTVTGRVVRQGAQLADAGGSESSRSYIRASRFWVRST